MRKKFILPAVLAATLSYAQVGINTTSPKTTMDVNAKRDASGVLTDNTQLIGLQAPRVTREELTSNTGIYGTSQIAALVYVTDVSGGDMAAPRTYVDAPGYYYFDGTLWQKMRGAVGGNEPWFIRNTTSQATQNTENIYQTGNVAIGTQNGIGTFNIDPAKNNAITGTPTNVQVLDDVIVTPGGRIGFGYSPSDAVFSGRQFDDKVTFQANDDLDINYSLATNSNAQAIVHRNIISNGAIGARTARPNGTSIAAFEGHTTTQSGTYGGGSLITQQRAGIVLRTGKTSNVGGEIWFGTSGATSDGTTATTAGNAYRAIIDDKGNWAFGADPNGDAFYRTPTQRLDVILGGVRIDALGYGPLATWQTLQSQQRPNYISTDPNDRVVVVDKDGVLKTADRSSITGRMAFNKVNNSSQLTPTIVENCPVYESEKAAQANQALPVGALYRINGSAVLMIKY